MDQGLGFQMHQWAKDLFPICRSITGPGVRETLAYLKGLLPEITVCEASSGEQVFDWVIPDEWIIRDAFIADESGNRIVDFRKCNLHVVGYSEPVDCWLSLAELERNLYSLPDQPTAIPYVTSYYARRWGFCLTHEQRLSLAPGNYRVVIDSELRPGVLNYAEILIPGRSEKEVFISTYVCHPSMANNEISGPVVTTALASWLSAMSDRRYSYRIVFVPETIGSIVYLSRNLDILKKNVIAGFNVTCIGDDRCYSFLPSRAGDTLSDQVARHVLNNIDPDFKRYTWLDRGSDERQYCSPGVDLPVATIMRSKYGEYPEYHTSLDDLSLVTPSGLLGGYRALQQAVAVIENNVFPKVKVFGEPQLGKRGLYPTLSTKDTTTRVRAMMDMISYCDGEHSLLQIAELVGEPVLELRKILDLLIDKDLVECLE